MILLTAFVSLTFGGSHAVWHTAMQSGVLYSSWRFWSNSNVGGVWEVASYKVKNWICPIKSSRLGSPPCQGSHYLTLLWPHRILSIRSQYPWISPWSLWFGYIIVALSIVLSQCQHPTHLLSLEPFPRIVSATFSAGLHLHKTEWRG